MNKNEQIMISAHGIETGAVYGRITKKQDARKVISAKKPKSCGFFPAGCIFRLIALQSSSLQQPDMKAGPRSRHPADWW